MDLQYQFQKYQFQQQLLDEIYQFLQGFMFHENHTLNRHLFVGRHIKKIKINTKDPENVRLRIIFFGRGYNVELWLHNCWDRPIFNVQFGGKRYQLDTMPCQSSECWRDQQKRSERIKAAQQAYQKCKDFMIYIYNKWTQKQKQQLLISFLQNQNKIGNISCRTIVSQF